MICINPGTEPVANTTLENALSNVKVLLADIDSKHKIECLYRQEGNYGEGRYCFLLFDYDNHSFHEIQMPGASLSKVRYMREEGQNIWDFPRLYIDDSSWIWCIAVDILKEEFAKKEDDGE